MPKLKTNKSIKKRFKITKNGKVLYRPAHKNHFRSKKSGKKKRKLKQWRELKGKEAKWVKQQLPYA